VELQVTVIAALSELNAIAFPVFAGKIAGLANFVPKPELDQG
jgi:hypothetical protein